jgi:hypothetical protein
MKFLDVRPGNRWISSREEGDRVLPGASGEARIACRTKRGDLPLNFRLRKINFRLWKVNASVGSHRLEATRRMAGARLIRTCY